jgi:hypothetical protein
VVDSDDKQSQALAGLVMVSTGILAVAALYIFTHKKSKQTNHDCKHTGDDVLGSKKETDTKENDSTQTQVEDASPQTVTELPQEDANSANRVYLDLARAVMDRRKIVDDQIARYKSKAEQLGIY